MNRHNQVVNNSPSDWRHAFRQHALDLDPSLGRDIPVESPLRIEQGVLRHPLLRSIVATLKQTCKR